MASRRESPDEGPSSERSESPFGPGEKMNYKSGASSKQKAAKSRAPSRKPSSPDADADERASAASAESDERRRVVPIPAEGPIVYVSYAYADAPEVEEFVNALRESGIRAQCDSLGFIDERNVQAATRYRDAINRSEHVFLFVTPNYIERASPGAETGVRMDIDMLSEWVLLDPHRHARVVSLHAGSSFRGSPILPFLHEMDIDDSESLQSMELIHAQLRFEGPWTPPTIKDVTVRRSEQVGRLLFRAGGSASAIEAELPVVTLDLFLEEFVRLGARGREQNNASSWIYSFVNDRIRSSLGGPGNDESWDTASESQIRQRERAQFDVNTSYLLAWATLLSGKSATSGFLRGTHVLAAILHPRAPWREATETCLWELGLDPDELRTRLAAEITQWQTGIPDKYLLLFNRDPSLPPLLLGDPLTTATDSRGSDSGTTWSTARGIARVAADDPSEASNLEGKVDHLGVDPDVIAFARVAASWDLTPPLAIGLFGDWGSGKTFFMKRMKSHIEKFSREARDDKRPQNQLEYCKYVVQIEFNAWHYSEGDLWACLVDHIFTNLRLSDNEADSEVARRVKTMLTEMDSLSTTGQAAEARAESLKRATDEAAKELAAAQSRLMTAQSDFTAASVRDVWDIIRRDQKLQHQIKGLLKSVGVNDENISNAKDIQRAIEEARSLGGRLKRVAQYLRSQPWDLWTWAAAFTALLTVIVLPALFIALAAYFETAAAQIGALVTATLSALAGGIPIYRTIAGHVSEFVDILDKPRRMAEEARRIELDTIQSKIQQLTEQRLEAEQHKKDIESQKQDLQQRIDAVNASRILTEFLQDRAGTDDYRKRLGTLALIRRDFERLSGLMSEQRREAMKEPDPNDSKPSAVAADDKYRVNRIVLYIDDLDRCAPAKVVEVLQAIHLLLAFPLFVVVVGVDARWVQRSIKQRYNELLRSKDEASHKEAQEELGIASPRDYLEKIFQVPFWLPPLNIGGCHDLMDGILKADVAAATEAMSKDAARQDNSSNASSTGSTTKSTDHANPVPNQPNSPAASSTGQSANPASPSSATASPNGDISDTGSPQQPMNTTEQASDLQTPARPQDSAVVVSARSVAITRDEADLMKRFAPIVGTSPRSVKRFINCYRLFKSVVPGGRATAEPTATETNLSMFFLAVVVGAPDLFDIIHRSIAYFTISTPTIALVRERIDERMKAADPRTEGPAIAQWTRVKPVLDRLRKDEAETELKNIAWMIERARRFGYDTAMGPTPPTAAPDPETSIDARARAAPAPA